MKEQFEPLEEETIELNAETVTALEELISGRGEEYDTPDDLWYNLEE